MPPAFRLLYHIVVLTLAVGWAFIWLRTPSLAHYSLQLFGAVIVGYFLIKRLNQADFWQLLPSPISLEMALATLAFLLVIGATGNIHSPLFPLSFIHLFFLVIAAESITVIIVMLEILLFHYSLTPNIGVVELSYLSSLPIVMIFFLIAKDQFYKVSRQQAALDQKTATIHKLQRVDQALERFITQLLESRLPQEASQKILQNPETNSAVISTTAQTQPESQSRFQTQLEPLIELDADQTAANETTVAAAEAAAIEAVEEAAEEAEAEAIATEVTIEATEVLKHTKTLNAFDTPQSTS